MAGLFLGRAAAPPVNEIELAVDVTIEPAAISLAPSVRDAILTGTFVGNRDAALADTVAGFLGGEAGEAITHWFGAERGARLRIDPQALRDAVDRDIATIDAMLCEQLCAVDRDRNFGTRGEDRNVRTTVRPRDLIGAACAHVVLVDPVAQLRQVLPREREDAWAVFRLERKLPALGGLHRVTRAEHEQIRNCAQRRKVLDGLMRRSVFAEAN